MNLELNKTEAEFLKYCCILGHNFNTILSLSLETKIDGLLFLEDNELEPGEWQIGDFYEDCGLHPCIVTSIDYYDKEEFRGDLSGTQEGLCGISLIDGTGPRSCSIRHCAPRRITLDEALIIKHNWTQIKADIDYRMENFWNADDE